VRKVKRNIYHRKLDAKKRVIVPTEVIEKQVGGVKIETKTINSITIHKALFYPLTTEEDVCYFVLELAKTLGHNVTYKLEENEITIHFKTHREGKK